MNQAQIDLAKAWDGAHDETYFDQLHALGGDSEPLLFGAAEQIHEPDVDDDGDHVDSTPLRVLPSAVQPVAGLATVLDQLVAHLERFVYFSNVNQAVAVALWVSHTHVINAVEQSPILAFMSAVRRSGKSRAIDVIDSIVARPWRAVRPSEAVFFRRIDRDQPTVLLDEIDTIFGAKQEYEGIRACLNAGNRPGTTIPRAVAKGKGFDLVDFKIYCAKVLAGIGELPETIRDRAIVITMTRKAPGDPVERLRARDALRLGRPIGAALATALQDVGDLTLGDGDLPIELDDRAQDGWEPLLALARVAGGTWPDRARVAAIAISNDRSDVDDDTLGIVLLRDIQTVLGEPGASLTTSQLIERLCAIDLAPWNDHYGKPISGRRVAKLLRPFGIRPEKDRAANRYRWGQFVDAWSRYLPRETSTSSASTTPIGAFVDVVEDVEAIQGRYPESLPWDDEQQSEEAPVAPICQGCGHHLVKVSDPENQWVKDRFVCTNPNHKPGTAA